jgi:hypothetical protein
VHREAKRKSIETKSSSQCHDRVANTTQATQRDVRRKCPGSGSKAREHDAAEADVTILLFGITLRFFGKIDDQTDDDRWFEGVPDDPDAADLDEPDDGFDGGRDDTAVKGLHSRSVITDQAAEPTDPACVKKEFPRQGGLAGVRWAPDEEPRLADNDAGRMDRLRRAQGDVILFGPPPAGG